MNQITKLENIEQYHKCLSDLYWFGCYEGDGYYKQFFDPNSYAHPAKISPLLASFAQIIPKKCLLHNKSKFLATYCAKLSKTILLKTFNTHFFPLLFPSVFLLQFGQETNILSDFVHHS